MTAPALDVQHLTYRDPHAKPRAGWTLTELRELRQAAMSFLHYCPWTVPCDVCDWVKRLGPGHSLTYAKPGWHGPLPADLHAAHEARERTQAEKWHAAHIADLAIKARRSANPMWERLDEIMPHDRCDEDVDAVMDLVYGGVW